MSESWRDAFTDRFLGWLSTRRTPRIQKRRPGRLQVELLEDRTTPTTLVSITPSPQAILDLDAPSTFSLKLVFSGEMNTAVTPTVSFPDQDIKGILVAAGGTFSTTTTTDDTYTAVFNVADVDETVPHVDVQVSGAKDFGNAAVGTRTVNNVFAVLTDNPVVQSVGVNKTLITSADVGGTFTVTVTYAEAMNSAIAPTINFNQDVSSTLTLRSGSWNSAKTVYTANYSITRSSVAIPSISINVSGGQDPDGFVQMSFTQSNAFAIDTQPTTLAHFPTGSSVQLSGDFNGDGLSDVAAYYPSTGRWLVAASTGRGFLPPTVWKTFGSKTGWTTHIVGDFNGDGMADIASFFNASGYAQWWVSLSNGSSFVTSQWASFGSKTGWTRQVVGDFNGDGVADIANFFNAFGYAQWWVSLSTGSGFFTSRWANFGSTSGWTKQVVGDFNGDGNADIANFYNVNGFAQWWVNLSNGGGFTTSLFGSEPRSSGWTKHLVGDFNHDGDADIASINTNGQVYVSLSTGAAFTTTLWTTLSPATNLMQFVGDFNHDGKTDLGSLSTASRQLTVGVSTGASFGISLWDTLPTTTALTNAFVGDFDGDGIPDIAFFFSNNSTGATQVLVSVSDGGSSFTTTAWR